ncbi:MAG: MFS transporter [Alphaproteobacteria bacterium]|nr:MFS transporter [Alphaproteobacteria bacterium]MBT4965928.1 MFS transporter [Alphaproteobacteria bacterium]MBT5159137.1 MFS transporter [Alphaproteobacteria bacterium]MBT5920022.1 MFS transporter [Alphaproteobacteria bacterium]MBT6386889.1 MFS transporter [Alphaproteobacteria bacterium]
MTSVERPYSWVVAIASLLLMTVGNASIYVLIVGLTQITPEFGGSRGIVSFGYSFALFGMGLGGILMGRLSDRIGMVWPAIIGAVSVTLGALVAARATDAWVFLFAHAILLGLIGNGGLFSPLIANVTRWFDRRRGIAVALVVSGQGLAGALAAPIFRWLLEDFGWRATYDYYAIFAICTLVPMAFLLWPKAPAEPAPALSVGDASEADNKILGRSPTNVGWTLNAAIIGCCIAMAMPMVHVVAHAEDKGHSTVDAAMMLSVLLGVAFFARVTWGGISDKIGGLPTLCISSVLQALALCLYLFVDSLIGLYAISVFFGVAFAGIVPSYAVILRQHFPVSEIGQRVGVIFLFGALGMALGGWLGGAIYDLTGSYFEAFLVGIAANVVNLFLVLPLLRTERRQAGRGAARA